MKKIWVITLFPEYFEAFKEAGVAGHVLRGVRDGGIELETVLLRDFSPKGYKGVDGAPYGGGPGMVMRADVLKEALLKGIIEPGGYDLESIKDQLHVVYTGPRGRVWDNVVCKEFAKDHFCESDKDLVFICGRYEGVDERFLEKYVDAVYCIGDYVLTGGEIAVLAILDSSMRFAKGVLGNFDSALEDSFEDGLIEHKQYTKPRDFEGEGIPEILLSGHHSKIAEFRLNEKIELTKKHRADLYREYMKKDK